MVLQHFPLPYLYQELSNKLNYEIYVGDLLLKLQLKLT
jgi:hypothetical protein